MSALACGTCGSPTEGGRCAECGRDASAVTGSAVGPDTATTTSVDFTPPPSPRHVLSFAPGHVFAERYTIVELVGGGGMGEVYKAIDHRSRRTVALKLIRAALAGKSEALSRFRRELVLAQSVSHPNVCRLHDLGEVDEQLYICMDYVDGQTLDDLIRSMGRLSPRQTVALGQQVCAALQAVHAAGVVHRDLKPGNVMVTRTGHAVVMDFGMAYHPGAEKLTRAGMVVGTLAYVAPEQARGSTTDARSDIYALGLLLYEMLTGLRPPGDQAPLPLALRPPDEPCPPPSQLTAEVPASLDAVVMRCLEREAERRYPTAAEVQDALAQVGAGLPTALMTAPTQRMSTWPARRRRVVGGVAAALALALAAAWLGWRLRPPPPPPPPASLAILPLAYDGPAESAYLREVLPFTLADILRGVPGLEVAPFPSSRTFAAQEDRKTVAQQLGVTHVLGGHLAVHGPRSEIELVLTAMDGAVPGRFRREAATESLGREIEALSAEVLTSMDRRPAPARGPSRSGRAYDRYVNGRRLLEGWDVERNVARAIEAFTEALDADEAFADAHAGLAVALWRRYLETSEGALADRALTEGERAVALAPSLPEAHLALGTVLLGRARTAEAVASFQRAQDLAPGDDDACRQIARAYGALKRYDEADQHYQKAIQLRPHYWQNYNSRGSFFLRLGNYAKAQEQFAKVIELRPLSWTGYSNKAVAHILEGEFIQAEPLLRTALQLNAGTEARTNLGFVLFAAGRYAEAAREYQAAVDAGAARAETYGSLGDAYRHAGRSAEARAAYARAIELGNARLRVDRQDAVLRAGVAMFLAGAGNCAESARQAGQATADTRADPRVHYYAAVAYAVCGDEARARRFALRSLGGGAPADLATNPDLARVREDPAVRAKLAATRRR